MPDRGVTSFKLFMAYPGTLMVGDRVMLEVMRVAAEVGAITLVHCENGAAVQLLTEEALAAGHTAPVWHARTRPAWAEAEATARALALAHAAGATPDIVHVSCARALRAIATARGQGQRVLAETCPQYLRFTEDDLARPGLEGAKYVFSPPARTVADQERLWAALAAGELGAVASDHCPFRFDGEKTRGERDFTQIPNGIGGVEERIMLHEFGVRSGRLSLSQWVWLTATAPARTFGLYPRKGTIAPGADADLVIFDPVRRRMLSAETLHSRSDYSAHEGTSVTGSPESVLREANGSSVTGRSRTWRAASSSRGSCRRPDLPVRRTPGIASSTATLPTRRMSSRSARARRARRRTRSRR
jgi:dihydropyrimidinase